MFFPGFLRPEFNGKEEMGWMLPDIARVVQFDVVPLNFYESVPPRSSASVPCDISMKSDRLKWPNVVAGEGVCLV